MKKSLKLNLTLQKNKENSTRLFIRNCLIMFKKILVSLVLISPLLSIGSSVFAENDIEYKFFYRNGCSHCAKVEECFSDNNTKDRYKIKDIEITNPVGTKDFNDTLNRLGVPMNKRGVPLMTFKENGQEKYLAGDQLIIDYFKNLEDGNTVVSGTGSNNSGEVINPNDRWGFFLVLIPAAISDSINPCEFAIMILLLGSILTRYKDRRKVFYAGFMFCLAVFLSYFLMGLGLFQALATSSNTKTLKIVVGILGIAVGLANMKDYFAYGKWFVMEVPFSWRPKMQELVKKVTSPIGAFFIGIVLSLFLLPCTAGPYVTVLGFLASESKTISGWGYIYLLVYNIVFIIPMIGIVFLIGLGIKSPGELREFKEANTEKIHLIVGFLMIGLGLYVLNDAFGLIRISFGG
ncbi:MAG: cytochrome c biogenesis CcdA family protein [Candidatus Gracilibacteria bacterium]|nr:cytochrome c biogenesis CcdA family protein [Candidatus Gracilibacteria bacterium]